MLSVCQGRCRVLKGSGSVVSSLMTILIYRALLVLLTFSLLYSHYWVAFDVNGLWPISSKKHSKSPTIDRQTATLRDQVLAKDRGVQIPS